MRIRAATARKTHTHASADQTKGPVKKQPISPGETAQNSHARKERTLPLFAEARLQICSLPSSARRPADLIRFLQSDAPGTG